ncbi:MAG: hypothetical protein II229_05970, partial [Clostridia bacterium]|nr:hypothetical protein [Clostridia bacterium]
MMNLKRILILIGTLLLAGAVAVAFAACDNTPDTPEETTPEVTDAPTEAPTETPTDPETEAPTEEATTEEITTEEETHMDPQAELSKLNDLMQPIFAGNTVKNETVMFLDKGDVRSLLYPIKSVTSVTNYDGTVTYEEGKDYVIEDGKIKITENSSIPVIIREKYYNYPAHPQINITANYEGKNVNIYWGEGTPMTNYQMNVTYTHTDTWKGFVSESQADVYAPFIQKLINGEDV